MGFVKIPVKGMNDFLPSEMKLREYVIREIKDTYQKFGFNIIETASVRSKGEAANTGEVRAKELDLKIIKYHDMIGELSKKYKTISIAGCHGKTTTTAMMAHVMDRIKGINYLIGDGTGCAKQDNEYFVLESCEYQRHFLSYFPYYTIITNIDLDHLDYFKDLDDILSAYQEFIDKTSNKIILCGDDINTRKLIVKDNCLYYGINDDNDVIAKDINYKEDVTTLYVADRR